MAPRALAVALAVLAALALVAPSQGSGAVCREGEAGCRAEDNVEEAALLQASAQQKQEVLGGTEDANLSVSDPWCKGGGLDIKAVCNAQHPGSTPVKDVSKGESCWSCNPGGGVDLQTYLNNHQDEFGDACCLVNKGTTPETKCYDPGWQLEQAYDPSTGAKNPDCK